MDRGRLDLAPGMAGRVAEPDPGLLRPRVSIVVPVYNGERSLTELVTGLDASLRQVGVTIEVILVDDGSPDGSWAVIEHLAAEHPWVRGIRFMRNFGQHNALIAGTRDAQYEVVVTMDDDLQHPPDQVLLLVDAMEPDVDLVYGFAAEEEHGPLRSLASRVVKLALASTLRNEAAKYVSAFRAFRLVLRDSFATNSDPGLTLDVLLSWSTARVKAVPVRMRPRKYGRSNYSVRLLLRHALNMITGYSTLPLRVVTYMGVVFSLFGWAVLVFVVLHYFVYGVAVPGFTFVASLVAVFSGAQMFALGIVGEYLGRIHFRSMRQPQYVVREKTGSEALPVPAFVPDQVHRLQ